VAKRIRNTDSVQYCMLYGRYPSPGRPFGALESLGWNLTVAVQTVVQYHCKQF